MGTLIAGLKPAREAAGLTQQAMAAALGWTGAGAHAHVGRVERGERSTSLDQVERWYELCGAQVTVGLPGSIDDAVVAAVAACSRVDLLVRLAAALPKMDPDAIARLEADIAFLERRYGR